MDEDCDMSKRYEELKKRPREQGKDAYRQGKKLKDNPYIGASAEDWVDGWGWQQVNFPRKEDMYSDCCKFRKRGNRK